MHAGRYPVRVALSPLLCFTCTFLLVCAANAQRQMENLGRGLAAIHQGDGKVFLSWRFLGTEPDEIAFDVYRTRGNGAPMKLNKELIQGSTCFTDEDAKLDESTVYSVRTILNGTERKPDASFKF